MRTSFPRAWPSWMIWCASAARSKGNVWILITSLLCSSSSAASAEGLHGLAVGSAAGHPRPDAAAPKLAIETT